MLDVYIIEKIRRDREVAQRKRPSLRIDAPMGVPNEASPDLERSIPLNREQPRERGIEIIDFTI